MSLLTSLLTSDFGGGGGGSGTVTSVGLTSTGNTITITGSASPITGAGSWNIEIAGTVGNVTGAGSAVLHALTSYGNVNGKVIEAISTITVGANSTLTSGTGVDFILQSQGSQGIQLLGGGSYVSPTGPLSIGATQINLNGPIIAKAGAPINIATPSDPTAPLNIVFTAGSASSAGDGANIVLQPGGGAGGGLDGVVRVEGDLDMNSNSISDVNNVLYDPGITVGAGGQTTLTNLSEYVQILTGSSAQFYKLPDATTMAIGQQFLFLNQNQNNTIIYTNNNLILSNLAQGGAILVTLVTNSTAQGSWTYNPLMGQTLFSGINLTNMTGTTLTGLPDGASHTDAIAFGQFATNQQSGTTYSATAADRLTTIEFDDTAPSTPKVLTIAYAPTLGQGFRVYNSGGNTSNVSFALGVGITAALEPANAVVPPGGLAIITEVANGAGFPIFSIAVVSQVGGVQSALTNGIATTTQLFPAVQSNKVRVQNVLVKVIATVVGPTSLDIIDSNNNVYISIPVASLVGGMLVTASNTTFINATNYGTLITNKAISATFAGGALVSGSVNIDLEYILS